MKTPETPPPAEKDPFEHLVAGRVVHYWPREHEARHCAPGPWAAIVTLVEDPSWPPVPGIVNLNVQMPKQAPIGEDPVCRFKQVHYSIGKVAGCWSWMFEGQAGRYKPDRTA
jgi:hypothetical protein